MLKYFLPDWEDRVDPKFDFQNDKFSESHTKDTYNNDNYAHQIFDKIPYDGILVSLAIFEKKISLNRDEEKYTIRNKDSIKDYLKIHNSSNLEVMGDCGAFSYVTEKQPPSFYNVEDIASIYQNLGFDYGVSVDHLAVDYILIKNPKTGKREKKDISDKENDRRIKITLKNAAKFLDLCNDNNYSFHPIGVAQGYSIETYEHSVKKLVDMGYDYIALGGIVQYSTRYILDILEAINEDTKNVQIHLFGVLRKDYLKKFQDLGVTSFDSASFFRKAWLRSGQNYLSTNGKWYSSIRVPQSFNPRIIKKVNFNELSLNKIRDMEKKALKALFDYDNGKIDIDTALNTVMKYDKLLLRNSNDGDNLKIKYRRTLLEKPWEDCDCPMCKELGINVLIFRGTNRNKRRGFHNIWALRDIENTLCVVSCGKKKIWDKYPKTGPTPAGDVYIGSYTKKCQDYAKKFYPNSWCIISAKYGFLFPEEEIPSNYDVSFNDYNSKTINIDELNIQAKQKKLNNYEKVVVIGGKTYLNIIKDVFPQKKVLDPLNGCKGIGQMMNRLNNLINN
jgi:hypothetical protein